MKLSFKFFCIAYIVVLLSSGLGGSYMIKSINERLWNTRIEQIDEAVNYGIDSFAAFTDASYDELSVSQINDAARQIKNMISGSISDIEIFTYDTVNSEYKNLSENKCAQSFIKRENNLLVQNACRIDTDEDKYYIFFYSDLTDIRAEQDQFWKIYGIVVFGISAVSGIILFYVAKRITDPLIKLTKAADDIAFGNYGRKIDIKSSDYEICALSESIDSMSSAIEQKIGEIREELERRNIFVADFTHEMKTPMTAIIGYAQMLRSYDLDEAEKNQASEAIYIEAKRLERLSLQLLDLYVYQNENIEMEKISLFDIGTHLGKTLKFLSEKYDVSYIIEFPEAEVFANSTLLLSLLYNLADNAFKASKPKSIIKIYSEIKSSKIDIFVKDEGRGIAKENIKLLTEPFYREDKSRSRKLGGAGLGLSLCKEIARIHGTELIIKSEKNKGTIVSFSLGKGGSEK